MKRLTVFLLLALAFLFGCAAFKNVTQVALTADDMLAQVLCAEAESRRRGIDLEQARETYCSSRDLWRPWLEAATQLRRSRDYQRAARPH